MLEKTKLTEWENKTRDISGLVKKSALTAVGNKIPDISILVKKQIMTQKLVNLKRHLLMMAMKSILLVQSLIF